MIIGKRECPEDSPFSSCLLVLNLLTRVRIAPIVMMDIMTISDKLTLFERLSDAMFNPFAYLTLLYCWLSWLIAMSYPLIHFSPFRNWIKNGFSYPIYNMLKYVNCTIPTVSMANNTPRLLLPSTQKLTTPTTTITTPHILIIRPK